MNIQSDEVLYFFAIEGRNTLSNAHREFEGVKRFLPLSQDTFWELKEQLEKEYRLGEVKFKALNRL
jgi:hypothetical protein